MNEHRWGKRFKEEADDILFEDLRFDERLKARVREKIALEDKAEGRSVDGGSAADVEGRSLDGGNTRDSMDHSSLGRPDRRSRRKLSYRMYGVAIAASLIIAAAFSYAGLFDESDKGSKLVSEVVNNDVLELGGEEASNGTEVGIFTTKDQPDQEVLDGTELDEVIVDGHGDGLQEGATSGSHGDTDIGTGMIDADHPLAGDGASSSAGDANGQQMGEAEDSGHNDATILNTTLIELDNLDEARELFGEDLLIPSYVPAGYELQRIMVETMASDSGVEQREPLVEETLPATGIHAHAVQRIDLYYTSEYGDMILSERRTSFTLEGQDTTSEIGVTMEIVELHEATGYLARVDGELQLSWTVGDIELILDGPFDREEIIRIARSVRNFE